MKSSRKIPAKLPSPVRLSAHKITDSSLIDDTLKNNNYVILHKIVIEDRVSFIKCRNPNQQIVFVRLNSSGITTKEKIIHTNVLQSEDIETKIPFSLKLASLECAKQEACGIAFECKDDICLLQHDDNMNISEISVTYSEMIESENEYQKYPIIDFDDIKNNPSLILKQTDDLVKKLQFTTFNELFASIDSVDIDLLSKNFNEKLFEIQEKADDYSDAIEQLQKINEDYLKNPPQDETEEKEFQNTQKKLLMYNENFTSLFSNMRKMKLISDSLKLNFKILKEINK
jgi:hypothetical protein